MSSLPASPIQSWTLRCALPSDAPAVHDCVRAAYAQWTPHIGREPLPMLQDYAAVIGDAHVVVAQMDRRVGGVLVLRSTEEGILVDNVAVLPEHMGQGVGRALLLHAEQEARRRGHASLYLYTHEKMLDNIALYERIGYVQFDRRQEHGFCRIYLRKHLR